MKTNILTDKIPSIFHENLTYQYSCILTVFFKSKKELTSGCITKHCLTQDTPDVSINPSAIQWFSDRLGSRDILSLTSKNTYSSTSVGLYCFNNPLFNKQSISNSCDLPNKINLYKQLL